MTSREFCYWLQGYFEIAGEIRADPGCTLTNDQVATIQKHLSMVFLHEIDPSYPDSDKLSQVHAAGKYHLSDEDVMRC